MCERGVEKARGLERAGAAAVTHLRELHRRLDQRGRGRSTTACACLGCERLFDLALERPDVGDLPGRTTRGLRNARQSAFEDLPLGPEDRKLTTLPRIGLLLEQPPDLLVSGAREEEAQAEHRQIAVLDLEGSRSVVHDRVIDADRPQDPPEAHRSAGREVTRREERRVVLRRGREVRVDELAERAQRRADLVGYDHPVDRCLQRVEVLDREQRDERTRARAAELRAHDAPEARRVAEALRNERDEGDPVDEREQRLAGALEDFGEIPVRRHERALDLSGRRLRALLELALVEHVERRPEEHVASVEHLVEERMHRAEHALVREVLGAPRLHQRLEVDRTDEVRLDGALGELAREDARLPRPRVDDAPEHRRRDPALRGPRRPGHEDVLAGKQRERHLREEVVTLDERPSELVEEPPKALRGSTELRGRRRNAHQERA